MCQNYRSLSTRQCHCLQRQTDRCRCCCHCSYSSSSWSWSSLMSIEEFVTCFISCSLIFLLYKLIKLCFLLCSIICLAPWIYRRTLMLYSISTFNSQINEYEISIIKCIHSIVKQFSSKLVQSLTTSINTIVEHTNNDCTFDNTSVRSNRTCNTNRNLHTLTR
jgi:hypothetical protein